MTDYRSHTHSAPLVTAETLRRFVDNRSKVLRLTRDQVATEAGVGRSTLFDWLSGTSQPSAIGWLGLATALHTSVADLFQDLGVPLTSQVERARLERGWTRGDLAKAASVSFATVRALEQGRRVRPDASGRVARTLDLDAGFIQGSARVSAHAETPLGRVIEQERLARGWTIAELARHVGAARQLVSAWLLGTEPVAERWLPQLAVFTGLPTDRLEDLARESQPSRKCRETGEWIRGARRSLGWSQTDLAAKVGVSAAAVEQWETGRRTPGPSTLTRLEAVLGCLVSARLPLG